MSTIPHFTLPFRIKDRSVETVDQDTIDDIGNCLIAILSTPVGWRDEVPSFGVPDLAFQQQPLIRDDFITLVQGQEPRAEMIFTEQVEREDELLDRLNVAISKRAV